jgi:hypothetical protein
VDADFTLLTVSTLQRLFLGIHPFWGQETGALRITAIERGARGFARALPSILAGRAPVHADDGGYHSANTETLLLGFKGSYTMDGELHIADKADSPLCIYTAGDARFLRV